MYESHFRNMPVTPGSVIIGAFAGILKKKGVTVTRISRFKFKEFVSPGYYDFRIEKKRKGFACGLFCGGRCLVTGDFETDDTA